MSPPPAPSKGACIFNLRKPGLILVIYNFFFAVPFAYLIAIVTNKLFQYVGYEEIMREPSGLLGTKILFVVVNSFMVLSWAKQMSDEEWVRREEREERLREIRRQVVWWDGEIKRLEGLVEIERKRRQQQVEQEALEQADIEFEEQLKTDILLAKHRGIMLKDDAPSYERYSVANGDGIKEWDFVVGAQSPKAKGLDKSGLKGLTLASKLPKLRKKKVSEAEES
ncbi:hypothetical protein EG329_005408 [Mollisiaceae sp. DMI_Dod_QoI]|nr:hypothetical protein EG329_005408 [Helotiales sp. DMI_Dod_QoI]